MDSNISHYTRSFIDQCDRQGDNFYKNCVESFQRMFDNADDELRWELIRNQKHIGFKVMLDNDETSIVFDHELMEDRCIEDWTGKFDGWIGRSSGAVSLLNSLGIPNEVY